MRYIPLHSQTPDAAWVARADALLDQLRNAPDTKARNVLIKRHSALWGELKNWLLSLSGQKCWFSEASDCFNYWDVEHYRPKRVAKDDTSTADGYWWLAFAWQNLRICGNVGNRQVERDFKRRC